MCRTHVDGTQAPDRTAPSPEATITTLPSADRSTRYRITPNLFGVGFGLAGLAEVWLTACRTQRVPVWPANVLFVLSAIVWLTVLVAFLVNRGRLVLADAEDPIFAPFVSLALITPVLLGGALTPYWSAGGKVVAFTAMALTALFGVWLVGTWILTEMTLTQWHPGYFLPTVAGGLVSSAVSAELGAHQLAIAFFGFGTVSWLVLGSILLVRLFTEPMVPPPLIPTLAIEVAPPVVAGNAWFAINGDRIDTVALLLVGYGILMTLLQLRLIPLFRRAPFGPGFWAFSFSYAAVFAGAIQWLALEHAHGARGWTYALLAVVTAAFAALIARTGKGLAEGTFLPRPPVPAQPRSLDPLSPAVTTTS